MQLGLRSQVEFCLQTFLWTGCVDVTRIRTKADPRKFQLDPNSRLSDVFLSACKIATDTAERSHLPVAGKQVGVLVSDDFLIRKCRVPHNVHDDSRQIEFLPMAMMNKCDSGAGLTGQCLSSHSRHPTHPPTDLGQRQRQRTARGMLQLAWLWWRGRANTANTAQQRQHCAVWKFFSLLSMCFTFQTCLSIFLCPSRHELRACTPAGGVRIPVCGMPPPPVTFSVHSVLCWGVQATAVRLSPFLLHCEK